MVQFAGLLSTYTGLAQGNQAITVAPRSTLGQMFLVCHSSLVLAVQQSASGATRSRMRR